MDYHCIMSDINSLTYFFYNIIPGILFLLYYKKIISFSSIKIENINSDQWIIYIIVGLFIGFLFQFVTKIFRSFINKYIWEYTKCKNNYQYKKAKQFLKSIVSGEDPKDIFYTIDNYLRASNKANLATYYQARLALWSNICVATFLLIPLNVNKEDNFILLIFGMISFIAFIWHLYNFYDVLLRSFVSIRQLDN